MLNDFMMTIVSKLPLLIVEESIITATAIEFNSICPTLTVSWNAHDGLIYDHIYISFNYRYLSGPSLHGAHFALDTRNLAHQRAMPLLQHLQRILRAVVSCAHINRGSYR